MFIFIYKIFMIFYNILSDPLIIYYMINGLAAILGLLYSDFLFAIHLFEVLIRFPIL